MMPNNRDVEFLYEISSLRNVQRGWRQHLGMDCANVLDHTMRVIWIAIMLARKEKGVDEAKVIKMALVHDLAEARVSDLSYVQKVYVKADEARAAADMFAGTNVSDYEEVLKEFEARKSLEAKIVKDADNLDMDFEFRELEEKGSKAPPKWQKFREMVRKEKLYTEAARDLWDFMQDKDPADWHLNTNKWLKVPDAGL